MSAELGSCGSFRHGHDVHWIQARKSNEWRREHPRVAAQLVDGGDDGWFTLRLTDGTEVRLWHHDVHRLRELARRNGNAVWYQARAALVGTASPQGSYLFCVGREPSECGGDRRGHRRPAR